MKLIVLTLGVFVQSFLPVHEFTMVEVRDLYEKAAAQQNYSSKLVRLLENTSPENFLLYGYKGAAMMIEAKYVVNPLTKLSKFKKGKTFLEEAIKKDPNNTELRYVRLTIQTNLPGFMGYAGSIKTDKDFVLGQLATLKDTDLRNRIVAYLFAKQICSTDELKRIGEWRSR